MLFPKWSYCTSERPLAHTLQEGRTPLHHASQAGKEAVAVALLEAKADVNSTDQVRRIAIGAYRCHNSLIEERGGISLRWGEAASGQRAMRSWLAMLCPWWSGTNGP